MNNTTIEIRAVSDGIRTIRKKTDFFLFSGIGADILIFKAPTLHKTVMRFVLIDFMSGYLRN
jgi:hypothetical protein